jgi:creatinine amidohydrolase
MTLARWWKLPSVVLMLSVITGARDAFAQEKAAPVPADIAATPTTTGPRQGYSIFRGTLVDMTWPEVRDAASSGALVLVPSGVIEEHGPHLSLGADTYMAYLACTLLRDGLAARGVPAVIAPPIYWGVMQLDETGAYPGSFTVRPETMHALMVDVLADLQRWGFRKVFLVELHGDRVHEGVLQAVTRVGQDSLGLSFFDPSKARGGPGPVRYTVAEPYQPDFHAGAVETSWMLKFFPEEVNVERARTLAPENGFHPLGYAGDPAGYVHVDAEATLPYVNMLADAAAAWMKQGAEAAKAAP